MPNPSITPEQAQHLAAYRAFIEKQMAAPDLGPREAHPHPERRAQQEARAQLLRRAMGLEPSYFIPRGGYPAGTPQSAQFQGPVQDPPATPESLQREEDMLRQSNPALRTVEYGGPPDKSLTSQRRNPGHDSKPGVVHSAMVDHLVTQYRLPRDTAIAFSRKILAGTDPQSVQLKTDMLNATPDLPHRLSVARNTDQRGNNPVFSLSNPSNGFKGKE